MAITFLTVYTGIPLDSMPVEGAAVTEVERWTEFGPYATALFVRTASEVLNTVVFSGRGPLRSSERYSSQLRGQTSATETDVYSVSASRAGHTVFERSGAVEGVVSWR